MKSINLKLWLCVIASALIFSTACSTKYTNSTAERTKPNILFIPVNDLRPEFGAYGDEFVLTPHMDRIASMGVTFMHAYCQQGYTCMALGKIFHNNDPDTISWSITPENLDGFPFAPDAVYMNEENLEIQAQKIQELKDAGKSRIDQLGHWYVKASVSYTDAQIGRLLDELERLELAENTIVVLWGDHGWKLGEHNGWCKQTNYEIDTRVPLIISGPGVKAKGQHSNALTEFVDIYPTLCEMAGLTLPDHLQGSSMAPLLEDPELEWKTAAYSQFLLGRFGRTKTVKGEQMGYAIRTDRYRYVEWYPWNKEEKKAEQLLHKELFDHLSDPQENINIASHPSRIKIAEALSQQLRKGWEYSRPVLH